VFETILLISPQLNNDAIFGCQFLREHGGTIDFNSEKFTYVCDGTTGEQTFAPGATLHGACNASGEFKESGNIRPTKAGHRPYSQTAEGANPSPRSIAVAYCNGSVPHPTIYGRKATQCTRPDLRIDPEPLDLERNQEFPDPVAKCDQSSPTGDCVLSSETACLSGEVDYHSIICKLSFPIVSLKMSCPPTFALKSNKIFIWCFENLSNICSSSS
jgi:hypothetical protein